MHQTASDKVSPKRQVVVLRKVFPQKLPEQHMEGFHTTCLNSDLIEKNFQNRSLKNKKIVVIKNQAQQIFTIFLLLTNSKSFGVYK